MLVIILMGPSGSGKTTVGQALAAALQWPFCEGDDFHPAANVERMRSGQPLSDADRAPWLDALAALVQRLVDDGKPAVIACSALKHAYRERLVPSSAAAKQVCFAYLDVPRDVLEQRLKQRRGHFFDASMLDSQLDDLEPPGAHEPARVLRVDAATSVEDIVGRIRKGFGV